MRRLSQSLRTIALVFGNRDLGRLQIAWAAMSFATWGFVIVLGVYAFREGGAGAVGLVAFVRLIPGVIATPLAGLLADRHSRRMTLIASAAAGALCIAAVALAVAGDASPVLVYALAGLFTVASSPYVPAEGALLPLVSKTPPELSAANVAHSAMDSAGFLAGSIAVGVLLDAAGFTTAFAAPAAAAALAALILLTIRRDRRPAYAGEAGWGQALRETARGARALLGDASLRLAGAITALLTLFEGAIDVLAVLVILDLLGLDEGLVGYLNAAWGVGALLGGAALAVLLDRGKLALALGAGCLVVGVACALPAAWPVAAGAFLAWGGIGIGHTFSEVASRTLLQRLGDDELLGRILGSLETVRLAAMAVGALLAPALVAALGIRGALLALAAVLPAFALLRWRALRAAEVGAPVDERSYRLLREDRIFRPLPVAAVERLSRELEPVDVAPGEAVVTQGDTGSSFFLIDRGEVDVIEDGVHCRVQGEGDSFGEIALLRDAPRTATVTARTQVRLLSLGRDDFLETVTGHARSHEAAQDTAQSRLGTSERAGKGVQ